jgi:hypothetical protein
MHSVLALKLGVTLSHPGSAIASMTQRHYCQHNSISTSHRGLVTSAELLPAWLGNTVVNMTQNLYRAAAKSPRQHDSTTPSLSWLSIYITSWPSRIDSTVTSTTWQRHHTTAWSSTSTIYDFSGKQTCCQLILVLFTIMFGSRANARVPLCFLAPPWNIYISKIHIWTL